MHAHNDAPEFWWGEFSLAEGEVVEWRIGSLTLTVQREQGEWRLLTERAQGRDDALEECSFTRAVAAPPESDELQRFVFGRTQNPLRITPVPADRPVVVRPAMPFTVPPGEAASIYVGSPLWLRIEAGRGGIPLCELPVHRPSDTWFGPSTREGELCYASRTHARLRLEDVQFRMWRAVTPVTVRNQAQDPLLLERISLPAPYLALFAADDGALWTPAVTLTREKDGELAALEIARVPPDPAGITKQVADAREKLAKHQFVRAFSALFG